MKNMKIFLRKAIIFAICLLLVDFFVGYVYEYVRHKALENNPMSLSEKIPYVIEKSTDDLIIFGASEAAHGYIPSIMQDSLGLSVYNAGQDGTFFIVQNCLINLMLERYSPKFILWEVGEACLSNHLEDVEYQSVSALYPYYSNDECRRVVNAKDRYQWIFMLSNMFQNNSKIDDIIKSFMHNSTDRGYNPLDTLSHPTEILIDEHQYLYKKERENILRRTIENCKDKKVTIIFVASPRFITDNVKEFDCYKRLRAISDEENIPFIDLSIAFNDHPEYFKDVSHLNDNGAKAYMHILIPRLKAIMNE